MAASAAIRLGRYELGEELGRGAMGVVYKGRDPQIDRLVAIKTISCPAEEAEGHRAYRERFFLEARAAGRLSHPGIVQIFDIGEQPDTGDPYIVMELVSGQPLSRMIANGKKLDSDAALAIAQETAEALAYAHSQGVVHRDIKPPNLLITQDGHVKIADFGVAKLDFSTMTMPGFLVGSPAYMAPEQLTGGVVDGRADLFSLGVILYSMLTGYRPFQGYGATTVSFKVVNKCPVPARALNLDLPADIDYVLSRAMAKDPEERYESGSVMAADLLDIRERRPPRSRGSNAGSEQQPEQIPAIVSRNDHTAERPASTRRTIPTPRRLSRRHYVAIAAVLLIAACVSLGTRSFLAASAVPLPNPLPTPGAAPPVAAPPVAAPPVAAPPVAAPQSVSPEVSLRAESPKSAPAAAPDFPQTTRRDSVTPPASSANAVSDKQPKLVRTPAAVAAVAMVSPRTAAASEKSATATTPLQVEVKHGFSEARVSLWVDDRLAYQETMHGEMKKRMLVFRGVQGVHSAIVQLPAGEHALRVRVQADGFDQSQFTRVNSGRRQVLLVKCDKRNNKLDVEIQSALDTASNSFGSSSPALPINTSSK